MSLAVFRTPLHPLPIALFLVLVAAIVVLFAVGQPRQALLGAVIVSMGVPVAWSVTRSRQSRPDGEPVLISSRLGNGRTSRPDRPILM